MSVVYQPKRTKPLPETIKLKGSMSPSDAAWALKRIEFKGDGLQPVLIDAGARDYLCTALKCH
jgi:hypothetical protein